MSVSDVKEYALACLVLLAMVFVPAALVMLVGFEIGRALGFLFGGYE